MILWVLTCNNQHNNTTTRHHSLLYRFPAVCFRQKSFHGRVLKDAKTSGAPNDRFLSNAFIRCLGFRLSGVLLKFCRLILGCHKKKNNKKKLTCSVILRALEYSRVYFDIFVHFPKILSYCLSENDRIAGLFSVPKATFLAIRKGQTLNFLYHKS